MASDSGRRVSSPGGASSRCPKSSFPAQAAAVGPGNPARGRQGAPGPAPEPCTCSCPPEPTAPGAAPPREPPYPAPTAAPPAARGSNPRSSAVPAPYSGSGLRPVNCHRDPGRGGPAHAQDNGRSRLGSAGPWGRHILKN